MTANHLIPGVLRPPDDDQGGLWQWRLERLLVAGVAAPLAGRLAGAPGVDLHALLDLVDRGCPPELAARIRAPVADEEPGA
jgi:hypothetical protein